MSGTVYNSRHACSDWGVVKASTTVFFYTALHAPRRGGFGWHTLLLDLTTASHATTSRYGGFHPSRILLAYHCRRLLSRPTGGRGRHVLGRSLFLAPIDLVLLLMTRSHWLALLPPPSLLLLTPRAALTFSWFPSLLRTPPLRPWPSLGPWSSSSWPRGTGWPFCLLPRCFFTRRARP